MVARLPRVLVQHRSALAAERARLLARVAELDVEIAAVDEAIFVIKPDWQPPKKVATVPKAPRLPRGAVSQAALMLLRQRLLATTAEIAEEVARRHGVRLATTREKQDFASAVAMALRRFERRGLVSVVDQDATTGCLTWRINLDEEGRLTIVEGPRTSAA